MPVEIIMPEIGESIHEATISRWLKKEGDHVKEDEPIVEIMTDKVNTELPSPATGTLKKIMIPEGSPVAVFATMGMIELEGETDNQNSTPKTPSESAANAILSKEPIKEEQKTTQLSQPTTQKKWYTPVVRTMAKKHGISEEELATIPGSGEGGRVTKKDLEAYLIIRQAIPVTSTPMGDETELKVPATIVQAGPEQEKLPLAGMRKMIAEAMTRSAQIPAVSTLMEVEVTHMVKFRERNKEGFQEQYGVKLTYTPFFIKAVAEALQQLPYLNASLQADNHILINKAVHIGVAVALGPKGDQGLIVPVIRDCHKKTIIEIAKDLEELATKARNNALTVSDVQGGTFTLTNPGSYGAILGTPMINAPQAAILGTYAIRKLPIVIEDMIAIRSIMNLVLTYDHRIIDGMLAGKFLQAIKEKLETFDFFK